MDINDLGDVLNSIHFSSFCTSEFSKYNIKHIRRNIQLIIVKLGKLIF